MFFAVFHPLTGTKSLQKHLHVIEEALSFDLVGHMWKLVEKWLQKWAKCETTSNFNIVDIIKIFLYYREGFKVPFGGSYATIGWKIVSEMSQM